MRSIIFEHLHVTFKNKIKKRRTKKMKISFCDHKLMNIQMRNVVLTKKYFQTRENLLKEGVWFSEFEAVAE